MSHLLTSPNYSLEAVGVEIVERAGEPRQQTKLTMPDALIVTTGEVRKVTAVVTQDCQLGRPQSVVRTCGPSEIG